MKKIERVINFLKKTSKKAQPAPNHDCGHPLICWRDGIFPEKRQFNKKKSHLHEILILVIFKV